MQVHQYDAARFNFPDVMRSLLGVDELTRLRSGGDAIAESSVYKNIETSPIHARLLDALAGPIGQQFLGLYKTFVKTIIGPLFHGPIYYQAQPTLRVMFVDARGRAVFHRDRDYGHNPNEVNFLVPQTPCFGTNAMWLSHGAACDAEPIVLAPGEFVQFDGANMLHGAHENTTGRSRVSFDFRIIESSRADMARMATPHEELPPPHRFVLLKS